MRIDIAKAIQNIRYGPIRTDARGARGTIIFDWLGTPVTITEPTDVLLVGGDHTAAARYIFDGYHFLLDAMTDHAQYAAAGVIVEQGGVTC